MLLKHRWKLILILLGFCASFLFDRPARAQADVISAGKFDEFGDFPISDVIARLDNFANQLKNEPDTRGFIVVYRSHRDLPGVNSRLATRSKNYLVNRGIATERVITIDGGEAGCLTQELWIAPPGTTVTPRGDAYARELLDIESVRKFDEYYLDEDDYATGSSLEAFAEALRKEPRSAAYIIAYPQYYIARWDEQTREGKIRRHQTVYHDPSATAFRTLRAVKSELVDWYRLAPSRIKVVNGGYRKRRQVELWIVPQGEHAPIATPNAFPRKNKAR
jgi:hypothetical protein